MSSATNFNRREGRIIKKIYEIKIHTFGFALEPAIFSALKIHCVVKGTNTKKG